MNLSQIETVLRSAPGPRPPAGLKQTLIEAALCREPGRQPGLAAAPCSGGWLKRWWPVLAPASLSLACAGVLTVQQLEIRDLKQILQSLSPGLVSGEAAPDKRHAPTPVPGQTDPGAAEQQEIKRLQQRAAQLAAEVSQLEQLRAENQGLRTQLASPAAGPSSEELADFAKMQERAKSISCANNLKQLGLASRLWAMDNHDLYPPNVLCMSNEISTPKILVCPSDTSRKAAPNWLSFTSADTTYDYLLPGGDSTEPACVLFRCPIHGHVGLADGSVQSEIAKKHPNWLIQRGRKVYLEPNQSPADASTAPQENSNP